MSALNNPVNRGNLWGKSYTWGTAIDAHAEASATGGDCRFIVTDKGIWMEGDGSRCKTYRTQLPKGAESYALATIEAKGLAVSSRDPKYRVCPRYA